MKKKKISVFLLLTAFFFMGFFVHAFFFPSFFTGNIALGIKRAMNNEKTPSIDNQNKALTIVTYEDGEFDPKVVVVGKSYYVGIINNSDKELMTLTSSNPIFNTPRGYAKSEQQLVQLYDVGTYEVSSLLHPNSFLKVIVK